MSDEELDTLQVVSERWCYIRHHYNCWHLSGRPHPDQESETAVWQKVL